MSLQSPLGRVLGLGTAREGTSHWWGQRVSAVALVFLGLWFAFSLAALPGYGYEEALAFIGVPLNSILLLLLSLTLAYHSYLGIQVVLEDYLHAPGLKLAALLVSRYAHILLAVAAVYAILKIGLGA